MPTSKSSNSPKPTSDSNPKKISTTVMDLLNEHKDTIPRIVARQTARITAMSTEEATRGRQLAPRTMKKKQSAKPIPLPTLPRPTPKRKSRARRSNAMDPPDNDPEDDPDNEYGLQSKRRRSNKRRRYSSSDSDSEDDSSDSSEADFSMHDLADESDEEERGDQSRRSPDDRDNGYSKETIRAIYDGNDSNL